MERDSGSYTMKAVTRMTGLSADALRAWERRHSAVSPARSPGGRRLYDAGDVYRLRLLKAAVDAGHAIGTIAGLSDGALASLAEQTTPVREELEPLADRLVGACERFDVRTCEEVLATAMAGLPVARVTDEVIVPALRIIGERWAGGSLSIANERVLSSAVKRIALGLLTTLSGTRSADASRLRVLAGTLNGELHEIGALLAAINSAAQGAECIYLGAELPGAEFARAAKAAEVDLVVLSFAQVPPPAQTLAELVEFLKAAPAGVQIWIGGAGAELAVSQDPERLVPIVSFGDFRSRLSALGCR